MERFEIKSKLSFLILLATILLVACMNHDGSTHQQNDDQIKALVHEYSVSNQSEEEAIITAKELIVTEKDGQETIYPLPEAEFFVSIAPYINVTHPCTFHSLTGCQGEMIEQTFDVYIEDDEGEVILEEQITTLANGFIDLWLPRDKTYQITINDQNHSAVAEISTFDDDATCITTMQLNKTS